MHTQALNASLTEAADNQDATGSAAMCAKCRTALERMFKDIVEQGTERKRINPNPKRQHSITYRDEKHQNEWLRENVFDHLGNYLFCCACIRAA